MRASARMLLTLLGLLVGVPFGCNPIEAEARQALLERFGLVEGSIVHPLPITEFYGLPAKHWGDLLGNFVLVYEIKAISSYERRLRTLVDRFSEYHRLFKDQGLVVLAMGSEPRKTLVSLGKKLGIEHPLARIPRKAERDVRLVFGITGLSKGALIDPYGVFLTRDIGESIVPRVLSPDFEGLRPPAPDFPIWTWPSYANRARGFLRERRFYRAISSAEKIQKREPRVLRFIENLLDERCRDMENEYCRGNFYSCFQQAQMIRKEASGTWAENIATKLQEFILENPLRLKAYRAQVDYWSIARDYHLHSSGIGLRKSWGYPGVLARIKEVEKLLERCPKKSVVRAEVLRFLKQLKERYEKKCLDCGNYQLTCCHPRPKPGTTGGRPGVTE